MKPVPELLAPGGSLSQAVHALRAGADAVYCGAPRFSARSHARNLDFADLRALAGEADQRGAAVYLALNTLLTDDELGPALETAWLAWEAGAKALIVQDIGLIRTLVRHGPPLPLHASTQMAIHSASGARQVQDWGITRVVLARELTLAEIETICRTVGELEYEVFIHGALCYGVSGQCLASGMLLGRSGNRGDCGQICRTWSTLATPERENAGFWFSMNDLEHSFAVQELAGIGVRALKIEGRMKPPEWTAAVVRHYRAILDDYGPDMVPDLDAARTVFGRRPSAGYLRDPRGSGLINRTMAGSVGVPIGTIEEVESSRVRVRTERALAVKDGIQLVRPGSPAEVFRTGIRGLELAGRPGRAVFDCPAGSEVWILVDRDKPFRPGDRGLPLGKVADHASNLPEIRKETLPLHQHRLDVTVRRTGEGLELSAAMPYRPDSPVTFAAATELQSARSDGVTGGLRDQLERQLGQSGDSPFTLGSLSASAELEGWFVPPSRLKQLRRDWYAQLSDDFAAHRAQCLAELAAETAQSSAAMTAAGSATLGTVALPPPRSRLSPSADLPFVSDFGTLEPGGLASWSGRLVLPLAPTCFDDEGSRKALADWLERYRDAGPFLFGLNNPAHLDWLRSLPAPAGGWAWFTDWALYAANRLAARLLGESLGGLAWCSTWVERERIQAVPESGNGAKASEKDPLPGFAAPDPDFNPPLFISRACFRHQSLGMDCPGGGPETCGKRFDYRLEQGSRIFEVKVRDCLSYTFSARAPSKAAMSGGTGADTTSS